MRPGSSPHGRRLCGPQRGPRAQCHAPSHAHSPTPRPSRWLVGGAPPSSCERGRRIPQAGLLGLLQPLCRPRPLQGHRHGWQTYSQPQRPPRPPWTARCLVPADLYLVNPSAPTTAAPSTSSTPSSSPCGCGRRPRPRRRVWRRLPAPPPRQPALAPRRQDPGRHHPAHTPHHPPRCWRPPPPRHP